VLLRAALGDRHLFASLALAFAAAAAAEEPPALESTAERYFNAETYCEAGTYGVRLSAGERFSLDKFAGCAHHDGRFKFFEEPGRGQIISWTDGETLYRYWQSNGQYREYPLSEAANMNVFGYRSVGAAFLQSRLFTRGAKDDPSLTGYRPSPALSSVEHTVFERPDERWPGQSGRFWVRNADKAIFKYEEARNGEVMRFVELSSQEVGRPLADAELSHPVSPLTYVSLQNNPAAFFTGLFLGALLAGAAFWTWRFARATSLDEVLRKRRLLWKVQLWGFGVTGVLIGALAVLSLVMPDSGHPPFIVVVVVMAIGWAVASALAALFTLVSYAVQRLVRSAQP
jgi:hypothetical protein